MVHELGYRDKVIIPDKYNTGLTNPDALVPVAEKFSGWEGYITPQIVSKNGGYTFENILFAGLVVIKGTVDHAVTFKNCLFYGNQNDYATKTSGTWTDNDALIFENCEFYNYRSACVQPAKRNVLKKCYIHHIAQDGGKAVSNGGFEDCYFYDLGFGAGAHSDGIQSSGTTTNFWVKNCRFDMPATKENVSNAGIFYKQETGDFNGGLLKDLILNTGGNYHVRLAPDDGTSWEINNLVASNIRVGYEKNGNDPNVLYLSSYPEYQGWQTNGILALQDKIMVSSVYKGMDGKIKVHATNYTLSDRTMVMVTDKETKSVLVPHCFDYATGKTKSISEFPIDVEFECDGDYVICYDTSVSDANEIRFQYCSVKKLFTDIADTIRSKTGSVEEIYRGNIPKEINDLGATLGTKSITQNGTYEAVDDDYDGYSEVTVNVPQPSGSIGITQNGTIDVTNYATAIVNVSGLPSYLNINEQTIESNTQTISIPYDVTKTVVGVFCWNTNADESANSTVTGTVAKRYTTGEHGYNRVLFYTSGSGSDTATGGYGSITFDTENEQIVIEARPNYPFRAGRTYRTIIVYAETT